MLSALRTESLKTRAGGFLKEQRGLTCGLVDQSNIRKEFSLMSLESKENSDHCSLQSSIMSSVRGNISDYAPDYTRVQVRI